MKGEQKAVTKATQQLLLLWNPVQTQQCPQRNQDLLLEGCNKDDLKNGIQLEIQAGAQAMSTAATFGQKYHRAPLGTLTMVTF
jgi:hypothetical protein